MLIFLLVLLLAGLGGFGYWAHTQGYLKSLPFQTSSDNSTTSSGQKYTTPPTINNKSVKLTGTGVDGFSVMWDTDQPSDSMVEYGPKDGSTFPYRSEVWDKGLVMTSHGVVVKGLTPDTEYQYRCISTNKDGLTGMSDIMYVKTPSAD